MAAGITFGAGFLMTPAVGAALMSASTLIWPSTRSCFGSIGGKAWGSPRRGP